MRASLAAHGFESVCIGKHLKGSDLQGGEARLDVINGTLEFFNGLGLDLRVLASAKWLDIALWQYLLAFFFITLSLFARKIATSIIERFLVPWIGHAGDGYTGRLLNALMDPLVALLGLIGLYWATKVLMFPAEGASPITVVSSEFVDQSFQVAVASIAIWAAIRLVDVLALYLRDRAEEKDLPVDVPVIPLLRKALKVFVGVVGSLLVIQHLGYPIASLLGGLGIGGLAVALAAQDTIANVFGSVIVFTDKPFKVGDWVQIGDVEGFVEVIGFRSTRIRTWPKSLVTLPNKTIANSHIENWSAMPVRRVSYTLRIAYDASAEQVEALVNRIDELVTNHPGVDQTFHLISFEGFGEEALEIMVYFFTISTAWKEHMKVRQEVNLEIMRIIEDLGLSIGVPSRRISLTPGSNELRMVAAGAGMEEQGHRE